MARLAQGAHNFLPQSVDQLLVEPSARLVVAANVVPDGRRVAKLSAANVARVAAAIAGPVLPVGRLVILATCFQKKPSWLYHKRCNPKSNERLGTSDVAEPLQVEHSRVDDLLAGHHVAGRTSHVDALPIVFFFLLSTPVNFDDGTNVTSLKPSTVLVLLLLD